MAPRTTPTSQEPSLRAAASRQTLCRSFQTVRGSLGLASPRCAQHAFQDVAHSGVTCPGTELADALSLGWFSFKITAGSPKGKRLCSRGGTEGSGHWPRRPALGLRGHGSSPYFPAPQLCEQFKGFSGPNVHSGFLGTQGSQLRSCHLDVGEPSPRARPPWDPTVLTGSSQAAPCLRLKNSCRARGATSHGAPGFPEAQRRGTRPAPSFHGHSPLPKCRRCPGCRSCSRTAA